MAQHDYRFFLADAQSLSLYGEIRNASSRSLTVGINRAGSASVQFPMTHDLAVYAIPWVSALVVTFRDNWVWSGPVSARSAQFKDDSCQINAVGWFTRLEKRKLDEEETYSGMQAGAIAFDLLAKANAQGNTFITPGFYEETQYRSRKIALDAVIATEINNLTEIESGFDWYVHPQTREMDIYARIGSDRPEIVWNYGYSGNLDDIGVAEDGMSVVNDLTTRGKFASVRTTDPVSQLNYGAMVEVASLPNVVDQPGQPSILQAYTVAELAYRSKPRVTYTLSPKSSGANVPQPFVHFDIGDTLRLNASKGYISVRNQPIRIFDFSVGVDRNGVGKLTSVTTSLS